MRARQHGGPDPMPAVPGVPGSEISKRESKMGEATSMQPSHWVLFCTGETTTTYKHAYRYSFVHEGRVDIKNYRVISNSSNFMLGT